MQKPFFLLIVSMFFLVHINAQKVTIPQIGVQAPSFKAQSTEGMINFPSDYSNKWKILICHPKDFTPVCSSEILALAHEQESFEEMGAQLVVLSTDIMNQHLHWKAALEEIRYLDRDPVDINFPLVADDDLQISKRYGMIHSAAHASQNIRGVYFIDPENTIRSILFYPLEIGRSVDELQRTLHALQHTYEHDNQVTPADWQPGDDVIVPVLTDEERANIGKSGSPHYSYGWFLVFMKSL